MKFRRPFEPFYTWWRHENYFTWVFFPYRNERLSRGERALIVVCSLYVTFYVLLIIVMLRDLYGASITILTSVVMYAILTSHPTISWQSHIQGTVQTHFSSATQVLPRESFRWRFEGIFLSPGVPVASARGSASHVGTGTNFLHLGAA